MSKIIEGQYTFYCGSPQEELDIVDKIFEGVNFDKEEELFGTTEKVLNLPVNEQIHFIHGVVDTMYPLNDKNNQDLNIEKFLAQHVFNKHRNAIMSMVDDLTEDARIIKIAEFENELNIKLVDSGE